MIDKMNRLEKLALSSAVSGAVFNVFLFGVGATLATATAGPLLYVRGGAAVLQATAFDLVAIATITGMRQGRNSRWSKATAAMSAIVSMLIALDVAGVWQQPWLHAANALIVLMFMFHLLAPRQLDSDERQKMTRLEQVVADLEQVVAERDSLLASIGQELAATRAELTRRPPPMTVEVIRVASHEITWEQMKALADIFRRAETISLSTIRRRVAELTAPMTEETH